jgi:PAS domain S-box-containing protein
MEREKIIFPAPEPPPRTRDHRNLLKLQIEFHYPEEAPAEKRAPGRHPMLRRTPGNRISSPPVSEAPEAESELELQETRRLLVESLHRYADFFDFAPVGFARFDRKGIVRDINMTGAAMLGEERPELIDRDFASFVTPDDRNKFRNHLERCRRKEQASTELRLTVAAGRMLYVHLSSSPFVSHDGGETFCLSTISDIADLKRALEEIEILNTDLAERKNELEMANTELQEANAELEAFNFTLSHDLRTPLSAIFLATQGILKHFGESLHPDCRIYVGSILTQAERISQIITSLLDFARISRKEISRENVDLSGIAKKVAGDLRFSRPDRDVSFTIAEGIVAVGDRYLLQVVLENLLGNAWKYTATREQAIIEFGMTEREGKPVCFVRDNGIGFDMEDAGRIFELFQRLHGREEYEGYGIGLGTVQRIIRRHGGRIWAEGETGKGAAFYFTLP